MKKKNMLLVSVLAAGALVACGSTSVDTNTISIDKKGVVTGTIVEEFGAEYYNADELKEMVDEEVSNYNTKAGTEQVTVESYEAENGMVKLSMTYAGYADYAAMNEKELFAGTVSDAYDAGYTFSELSSADGEETISKDDILEMGSDNIVICEEAQDVIVPGKILYVSSNVEATGNKTATVKEEGELAYILYQ